MTTSPAAARRGFPASAETGEPGSQPPDPARPGTLPKVMLPLTRPRGHPARPGDGGPGRALRASAFPAVTSRPWTGWARLVLRHRAAAPAGGLLVVTALVIPLFSLRLGEPASKALAGAARPRPPSPAWKPAGSSAGISPPSTGRQVRAPSAAGAIERVPRSFWKMVSPGRGLPTR